MRSENLEIPGFNRELCGTWYGTCTIRTRYSKR